MDEWVSKRELLAECGISYGQLYRWKREGLIPESWFVKRATSTGQETFLPRKQSVERVKMILGSRGRCSQTALQKSLFPPERTYKSTDLIRLQGVTRPLIQVSVLTGAKVFTYNQALCAMIAADILSACEMPDEQLKSLLKNLLAWAEESHAFAVSCGQIVVFRHSHGVHPLWLENTGFVRAPIGCSMPYALPLAEIPERFNTRLHSLP